MRTVVVLFTLAISALSTVGRTETLTFAVEHFCPYMCVNQAGDAVNESKPGFQVTVVRHVFADLGYQLAFIPMPFSRAIVAVHQGGVHGMIAMLKKDAPNLIFPEQELGHGPACFLVRKGASWRYRGIESLREIRFGGVAGYSYGVLDEYLADDPPRFGVQLLSGEDAQKRNLEMLLRGRIDATLDDRNHMQYLVSRHGNQAQFQWAGCLDA